MSAHKTVLLHFVFTAYKRRPFFTHQRPAAYVEAMLRAICAYKHIEIRALAIQPDHVHVFVTVPATMPAAKVAALLKWFTSLKMREKFACLNVHQHMWGRDYFVRSVGGDRRAVQKYIDAQIRGA